MSSTFDCECKESFPSVYLLKKHKSLCCSLTASNEEHQCAGCGRQFTTRRGLNRHLNSCSQLKPDETPKSPPDNPPKSSPVNPPDNPSVTPPDNPLNKYIPDPLLATVVRQLINSAKEDGIKYAEEHLMRYLITFAFTEKQDHLKLIKGFYDYQEYKKVYCKIKKYI